MKFQAILSLAGLFSICTCVPVYQPQIGIITSNSNEILGLNRLTLAGVVLGQAQGTQFLSPFLIQQQPPQVLNFNPPVPGPFLPPQINQLNPAQMPPLQQEQPVTLLVPNNALPSQNPVFPYFLTNLFPLRNYLVRLPPNQNAGSNVQYQATNQPTQPVQNAGNAANPGVTPAPDYCGDRPGLGTGEQVGCMGRFGMHMPALRGNIFPVAAPQPVVPVSSLQPVNTFHTNTFPATGMAYSATAEVQPPSVVALPSSVDAVTATGGSHPNYRVMTGGTASLQDHDRMPCDSGQSAENPTWDLRLQVMGLP
ncbi:uncharacterized protein LOC127444771 [Myxocyprinus asiaticus]|uniref:uncharacterized protein LOC127444771 n=1 Tax=Myxocyprinus asiaticus TaxID=70543 RepID=UPI00222298B9|nr:uncharacterized protein LOC127444771 [Myxocyprinus asiaticus]